MIKIIGDEHGAAEFICFANHSKTNEVFLVFRFVESESNCAMPFFDGDIFNGSELPANKRFSIQVCPTQDAPDLGESVASDNESKPAPKRVI